MTRQHSGTLGKVGNFQVAVSVHAAGVLPQGWLLAEWTDSAAQPTDFRLAALPDDTAIAELMRPAKIRRRIKCGYRQLKTGLPQVTPLGSIACSRSALPRIRFVSDAV